jgi:hypothetical protein
VKAELNEFGLHGDARDAKPPGGFGLIALGLLNGAGEKFALGRFKRTRMMSVISPRRVAASNSSTYSPKGRIAEYISPPVLFSAARTWSRVMV